MFKPGVAVVKEVLELPPEMPEVVEAEPTLQVS
jgi:hypothetical protein